MRTVRPALQPWRTPRAFWLLVAPVLWAIGCAHQDSPEAFTVLSWSGSDASAVPLDQELVIEFNQPLTQPWRHSSVEVLDEGGNPVVGLLPTVVGSWLRLAPRLPLEPGLQDGSLRPDHNYQIRLHGLPRLVALTSTQGEVLRSELILPFHTAPANHPAALVGNGAEFSAVNLSGYAVGAPLAFAAGAPLILHFRSGLDPRTITGEATLQSEGGRSTKSCALRLRSNALDGAELEVLAGNWSGWGRLQLPEEIEGLGGWPLENNIRTMRIHRAPQ
jgi:hypothetical protein